VWLVGWLASAYSSLMMEAVRTSETSVDNHFTRQYNPEDSSEQHRSGRFLINMVASRRRATKTRESDRERERAREREGLFFQDHYFAI
jgi:hypothetical protein